MSTRQKAGAEYLHVDALNLVLNIKKVRLSVSKIFNNNRILSKFSNFNVSEHFNLFFINFSRSNKFVLERKWQGSAECPTTPVAEEIVARIHENIQSIVGKCSNALFRC